MEVTYISLGFDFSDLGVERCSIAVCGVHSTTRLVAGFELVGFRRLLIFSMAIGVVDVLLDGLE